MSFLKVFFIWNYIKIINKKNKVFDKKLRDLEKLQSVSLRGVARRFEVELKLIYLFNGWRLLSK